ncbi:MAG: DUF5615 family PIN-like protein [Planctomycetia bacterium]|nr:DUF5615 family PIN-like protein [Planctomycetia bacterium]
MQFLADMGVSTRVTQWLRSQNHDVVHLRDRGLQRLPNGEIFRRATQERRVVLTFDLDFGEIVAASHGSTVSVVLFRLRNTRSESVIARLETVLPQARADLLPGAIVVVDESRHRVRAILLFKMARRENGTGSEHKQRKSFQINVASRCLSHFPAGAPPASLNL